jgi:glucose/mannose transport system substrate-binding protein
LTAVGSSLGARLGGEGATHAPDRLRSLVVAHEGAVRQHLATRLGVPSADVEDVAQEVFLVAAFKLAQIEPGCERAFLFATAHRLAGNARRGQRRRGRTIEQLLVTPTHAPPNPEELIDQLCARSALDEALESLPSDERAALVLYELRDVAIPEIGSRLGVPDGTVASRLRRARERLGEWATRYGASHEFRETRATRAPAARESHPDRDPEVFSWWVSGGEVDALRALVSVYEKRHPRFTVVSAAASRQTSAHDVLRSRMTYGKPPDTFQINGGRDLRGWVRSRGFRAKLEPLDFLFASEGWSDVFPPDIVDMVSHAGRAYAVPLNIHRTNALYYNARIFRAHGLALPRTLTELHTVADTLRARGVTPMALGIKHPWTLTMLAYECVMVSDAGGERYVEFFSGRRDARDGALRSTLDHVGRILGYANADAALLTWDQAVDRVRTGDAAMTITGDWAKGYLINKGCRIGEDFGEIPMPGASGAFVFALDTFGLPRDAPHPTGAIDLLKAFGSREGQDAFSPVKGSIPARIDVDLTRYNSLTQTAIEQFQSSPRFPSMASIAPTCFTRPLEAAMAKFAETRSPDVVLDAIREHYDLLPT